MIVTIILDIDGVSHVCRTFENESIQITKLVASIDNLGSQGTVTRQSFRLPLIGGLLDAIGDVTDPSQSAKVNLNKSIKGRILVDGFERFVGSFFVVDTTKGDSKEVEMIFQGNETDLKAALSNITMAELYEGESVLYNYTEIKQYFDAPETYRDANGYLFPLINFGQNWDYIQLFSGLKENDFKLATTFKKAFQLMPFNITTNGIDVLMNQAIVLHNSKDKFPILNTSGLSNTGGMRRTSLYSTGSNTPFVIPFQFQTVYNTAGVIDLPNNQYVCQVDGSHTFTFNCGFNITKASGNTVQLQFFARKNSLDIGMAWRTVEFGGNSTASLLINDEITLDLVAGDRVSLVLHSFASATNITGVSFECIASPAFFPTSTVNISANCPELTAWDIFRTIAIQSNAQIISNPDGTYEMTPFNDWIEEGTEVIVLDDIIEDGVDVQIKPFSVQGAKSISLGYKENSDYLSTQYKELTDESFGNKTIANTGTEFAKNELKIELPVSTIPHRNIGFTNCPIPSFTDKDGKIILGSPTILNTSDATGSISWTLKSLFSANSTSYNSAPFTGNWETIAGGYNQTDSNFGQSLSYFSSINYPSKNLYQRYWKKYLEETYSEESREIKMNIKLSINQIDSLKFNEKFYYKNTLLRLVKLEGVSLTSDQPATATFMKRFTIYNDQIAVFYPYNVLNSIVQWKRSSNNADLGDANTEPAADVEASAIAYGFFYDAVRNIATQSGQILIT